MADYDGFAEKYEKLTEKFEIKTRKHTHSLIKKSLKNKKLLDVGCGPGVDAKYYNQRGAKVFGIDISKKKIGIANKKVNGNFVVGDMNKLPYKSNTFDIITSTYSLQNSKNVTKAIKEMIRVAKPKAQILILTKHPFRNLIEGYVNNKHYNYYKQGKVISYIFKRQIKLSEPGHTLREYLHPSILKSAKLEFLEEHSDFPLSEQVIPKLNYPTYIILSLIKNSQ
ncbi:MAG: class I SAM-dependent methyltransferase [Nanoarchaeota archaeon]